MQVKLLSQHPTTAMKAAGAAVNGQGYDFAHHTWAAMFAAAPSPVLEFNARSLEAAMTAGGLEHEMRDLGASRLLAISREVSERMDAPAVLSPSQCASQFRMYASSNPNPSAAHQLKLCADFLDEFCTAPALTSALATDK